MNSNIKQKYLRHLDELISEAQSLPIGSRRERVYTPCSGNESYETVEFLMFAEFVQWRTSAASVLDAVVPRTSIHRKAVDAFPDLKNNLYSRNYGVSFLKSIRHAFEQGLFEDISSQIDAEISAEYLNQAEALLSYSRPSDRGEVAAAVITGAVLEHGLRMLYGKLEPKEPVESDGKALTLGGLIEALKKRAVFNELTAKHLRAWADIRNTAAHGRFDEFTRPQVEKMVAGVTDFLARHG
ncbi:hypothetical protein [Candidatus Electronema sp. PJ]|uniref:hypothetical protein n=1 Tax=Candidatus Electronema sp. PJ TaxID=3401572 RepID=UPI003AA86827